MNGVTQWEAKEIIREKNDRIEALTAKLEKADALLELQNRDISRLREAGSFLLARLDDLEWLDGQLEETSRQYFGHVDPAVARFRAALEGKP